MTSFVSKPIFSSQTVGEELRKAREGAGLSLDSLSRLLHISAKYLAAIESGSYAELPGEIYGLEFIKRYAVALRMDPSRFARLYRAERTGAQEPAQKAWRLFANPGALRAPGQAARFAALAALIASVWYASFFGKSFLGPPRLAVASPGEYSETQSSRAVIQGSSRGASLVLLNGEPLPVEQDGSFTQAVSLSPGYHLLRITARGRAGKETSVYRAVLVRNKAPESLVLHNGN